MSFKRTRNGFLWLLLASARSLECSDIRDKVFGLVGLYKAKFGLKSLPREITPDYSKNAANVIRDATRLAIKASGGFHLDIYSSSSSMPHFGTPSWVFNWLVPVGRLTQATLSFRNRGIQLDTYALLDVQPKSPNVLAVQGAVVDFVGDTTIKMHLTRPNPAYYLARIWDMASDVAVPAAVVARTLSSVGTPEPTADCVVAGWLAFSDLVLHGQSCCLAAGEEPDLVRREQKSVAAWYEHLFWDTCNHRRFFTTSGGGVGIGPGNTQSGDAIVILPGHDNPFILRRSKGKYFKLIGMAYIHALRGDAGQVYVQDPETLTRFKIT